MLFLSRLGRVGIKTSSHEADLHIVADATAAFRLEQLAGFGPAQVWDKERLFDRRRDLFTSLDLVFFDTTSIFFEGGGGETLGERGYSRADLAQMVVGVVIDSQGVAPLLRDVAGPHG